MPPLSVYFSLLRITFIWLLLGFVFPAYSQYALITGKITDQQGQALADAAVFTSDNKYFTSTNSLGQYRLELPAEKNIRIIFSFAGASDSRVLRDLSSGDKREINIQLDVLVDLKEATVQKGRERSLPGTLEIDPKTMARFPTASPSIEQFIKTLPGVSVSNELSSAYNVRGGNFDENLVYVNDIEVYRPFLVRSGQQEGLSFVNPDLVSNITFSAGGFEARYGDKLSSVLNIEYKKPQKQASTLRFDLMGVNLSAEGIAGKRLSWLIGARYQTNRYVLNSLDVQGDYKPRFFDVQSWLTWKFNDHWNLGWLMSASENRFLLVPQAQETSFGTAVQALRIYVAFGGQELMQYRTLMNGLSLIYQPNQATEFKWIAAAYSTSETEHYTVEGAYRLDELENNLGSDNFAEARSTLGTGYFIHHARNNLYANVKSLTHLGRIGTGVGTIRWGLTYKNEQIDDRLREWKFNDSAGYSVGVEDNEPQEIILDELIRARAELSTHRLMGHIQNTQILHLPSNFKVTYGIRSHWWSFNGQNVISPRLQFAFEPNRAWNKELRMRHPEYYDSLAKRDIVVRGAFGFYYQPPFYREMRGFDGTLNTNIRAQRAIHAVVGTDWNFKAWNRPFKFYGEAYFKELDQLVPYVIDNVRIRYYANNSSRGYATGIDARVNGEFIKGLESWVSLSVLQTKEDIRYVNSAGEIMQSGLIRRPTDQRVNASILFQDELRTNPSYKMHLRLVFGSGVPYFFTGDIRYKEGFTIPPYRRADLGFSKVIIDQENRPERLKFMKNLWVSMEIFNLLAVNNTISYLWIKDINNNTYGIPNFLTGRRLNFRVTMDL